MRGKRPGRGSLFRDLHTTFQLWPYYDPDDWYVDFIPEPRLKRKFENRYLPEGHPAEIHLRSANDSGVLGIDVQPTRVTIRLNDFDAVRLASRLFPLKRPALPVVLTFDGVKECFAYRTRDHGFLHRLNHAREAAIARAYEFDSATLLELTEDRVAMILSFHQGFPCSTLVLAIDARSLAVEEHQREGWIASFGDEHLATFDRFFEERKYRYFNVPSDFDDYVP